MASFSGKHRTGGDVMDALPSDEIVLDDNELLVSEVARLSGENSRMRVERLRLLNFIESDEVATQFKSLSEYRVYVANMLRAQRDRDIWTDTAPGMARDSERWAAVLKVLGGSVVEHPDGRTYFCVPVEWKADELTRELNTKVQFTTAIDAIRQAMGGGE